MYVALLSSPARAVEPSVTDAPALPPWRSVGPLLGVLLLVGVWAIPVTHAAGGRDGWVLTLGLVSALAALLLVRPWRALGPAHLLLPLAPALAALVVCLTSLTRWDGADETATLAYAGVSYLVVRAYARDAARRAGVLVALAVVGLDQFAQAYLPWWGRGDVTAKMVGTFYWHNQFGAFLAATGIVAAVLAVRGSGVARLAGWLVAPWCVAGLLFSASRGSLLIAVLAWAVVVTLSLCDRRGRLAAMGVVAAGFAVAWLLSGPWLMEQSGSVGSTVAAREAEQSVSGNGQARLYLWQAALHTGAQRPLTGLGFDSFGGAGSAWMPLAGRPSTYAHNGFLQAWSDGGLLLAAAVAAVTAPLVWCSLVALWRRRTGTRGTDVAAVAAPVGVGVLLLHSAIDFDWAYPSLLLLLAILAALVPLTPRRPRGARPGHTLAAALVVGLLLVSIPLSVRDVTLRAPAGFLPSASACRAQLGSALPADVRHGLACTAELAEADPVLAMQRALARARLGQHTRALREARAAVTTWGERRAMLRAMYAQVLAAVGDPAAAREELRRLRVDLERAGQLNAERDDYLSSVERGLQEAAPTPDVETGPTPRPRKEPA